MTFNKEIDHGIRVGEAICYNNEPYYRTLATNHRSSFSCEAGAALNFWYFLFKQKVH